MSFIVSKVCPKCGTKNDREACFCTQCLAVIGELPVNTAQRILPELPADQVICPFCQKKTPARFDFCVGCLSFLDGRFTKGCPTCGLAMERNTCSDPACMAAVAEAADKK